MRPLRRRRLARVLLLRGLRIARRHHFSVLSIVILAGALAVALTSASFELNEGRGAVPAQAAAAAAPAETPSPVNTPAPDVSDERKLVYYIVNSQQEIDALYAARRADMIYLMEWGLPPMPQTWVYYLMFETPEDEAAGARFLNQMVEVAPAQGFSIEIVDLTR